MKQTKKTKHHALLTDQRLLDIAARADAVEGIRQGLEDARHERIRPAREFFADFETGRGILR
jgi:hypothetical protein